MFYVTTFDIGNILVSKFYLRVLMAGFYERKKSISAIWCHRLGVFSIPYFAIAILMHRFGAIQTPQLFAIMAIGLVLALIAMVLALKAAADLWSKGHKGGVLMVRGMFMSLMVLTPFAYYAYLALALPLANDVSTNTFTPPAFIETGTIRAREIDTGINQLAEFSDEYAETQLLAYPKVGPRRYPAGSERVLQAVNLIIENKRWKVVARSGILKSAPDAEKIKSKAPEKIVNKDADAEVALPPADIYIEVTVSSPIFGYKNDAVIHIIGEDVSTLVEMRSSSRWGAHDFGINARIIENFMNQLDFGLLGIAGEG